MKTLKKILAITLALTFGLVAFAACGNNEGGKPAGDDAQQSANADVAGVYEGQYVKMVASDEKEEETFSLTLKADGTGVHARDDMEFNVTWKLEDGKFTMEETFVGDPIVYTGTLEDGHLHLYNGDPEDGFTYEYDYLKK